MIRVHGPSEHSAERDGVEIEIITPDFLTLKRNVYILHKVKKQKFAVFLMNKF